MTQSGPRYQALSTNDPGNQCLESRPPSLQLHNCTAGRAACEAVSTPLQKVCTPRLGGVRALRLPWLWGLSRGVDGAPGDRPRGERPHAGMGFPPPHVGAGGGKQAQPLLVPTALPALEAAPPPLPARPPGFRRPERGTARRGP